MTVEPQPASSPEFREAFVEAERQVRINTGRLACALVFVLMPFGYFLDLVVYPERVAEFFQLRILCSLLVGLIWVLHGTQIARRRYPIVGLPIVILPVLFMTIMIYRTEGPISPYYAGLNLVLLAVSAVGHWSFIESAVAGAAVIGIYTLAVMQKTPPARIDELAEFYRLFNNNLYFLLLTGVIVVAGNTVFSRLRLREFSLRFELDQNRRSLEETNQKLLELDQAKSHFFANLSHELRTPLTLLLAPLESLLRHPSIQRDPTVLELLHTMQANGLRLLRLINDLLDLVRLESGHMEVRREALPIQEFIPGLLSSVRPAAQAKRITLEHRLEPGLGTVELDRDKMEKILLNLVFNAIKFTPHEGRITVRAGREAGELVLAVEDTGIGIPTHQLPSVFSRFWQADTSSRRRFQGAGIGLALVKELTEIQGGTASVASQEGRGTVFTLRLPYLPSGPSTPAIPPPTPVQEEWLANLYRRAEFFPAAVQAETDAPLPTSRPSGNRPQVVVADDEPDMLRFLQTQLSRSYEVTAASDGQEAVDKVAAIAPDLVLLDMMMPAMDGLEACRALRRTPACRSTPIVLLTARADEETKLAALSAGASDFLTKPFSTTELEVRVRNLVNNHQLQRELARQNRLLETTIEQLKDTEVQLVQAEKLASLGRLSAGIIHEINNPLNFAATCVYSLRRRESTLPEDQRADYLEIVNDIDEGLRRVRNIVSDLRAFTHVGGSTRERVHPAGVAEVALRFLSHELREHIPVQVTIPDSLAVMADRNRLLQVFVNLLQNAVDALRSQSQPAAPPRITVAGRTQGAQAILTVHDNGPGIDPTVRDKIFDPFFTTKDVGQGLGLGLSICYRIIEEFEGTLEVRSEPGQFTEMVITLPAAPETPA